MCDYSLHNVKTRPARVGDRLTTRLFNITTRGFAAPEEMNVAVCLLPGTELSFTCEVMRVWPQPVVHHKTAIFRQINLDKPRTHHDALEFPDGQIALLTSLQGGQLATVLQIPVTAAGSSAPAPQRAAQKRRASRVRVSEQNIIRESSTPSER
jgi:hypothetical protein